MMPAFTNKYDDLDDLEVNGQEDLKDFIKSNHRLLSLEQMDELLGISPELVREVLTRTELRKVGYNKAGSLLVLRDPCYWEKDCEEFADGTSI